MKVKKVLGLLISIFVLFILSNNAFAVTPEGMSEELKNILNEEGKLVITDTTNSENKNQVLLSTINKYTTNEYGVHAYFTNSENTKCRIERYKKNPHSMLEGYDIEVKYEEKYSDEFKKVTEDGKIFITSTSVTGKEKLLWDYCDLFRSNDFSFNITDLNEDKTVGTLQMFKRDGVYSNVVEQHIVKIIYEEKFSDEFKKTIGESGIKIRASRDDGRQKLIDKYCSAFSSEERFFSVRDLNEDGTLCTIQMYEQIRTGNYIETKMKEQHVVKIQYDKTMSENFKKHLNKNGKFVINSIKPQNRDEWIILYEILFWNLGITADTEYLSEDMSSCEITIIDDNGIPETHKVEFEYKYDEKVKEFADTITNKIPSSETYTFNVKDMELINYWLNSDDESEKYGVSNFDNYSGELKSFVNYKNFNLLIDHRLGADAEFLTLRGGMGLLQHKGTTYYINGTMEVLGNHILYVPDDTGNTIEELTAAIQKRVDEYAGPGKVKIIAGEGTILEYYKTDRDNKIKELQNALDIEKAKEEPKEWIIADYEQRMQWAQTSYEYFLEEYNNPNGENYFLKSAEGDYWFKAIINGIEHKFIVIKDSKSMITPKHKTTDLTTDVEISTDSNDIPLDTIVEAEKLTEGEVYEKLIKILGVEENATFDLNLFSKSLNDYIRKLESGKFEVRIPVPENLKNKNLVVYYVDGNNQIEEYEVEIQDGYAIFSTNHFSTYTLAAEKTKENIENNVENNIENNVEKNEDNKNNLNTNKKEENFVNPNTGDNILFFIGLFIISILGIIITIIGRKNIKTDNI